MVIDTSALVAILQGEPDRRRIIEQIEGAAFRRMSLANYVEISMVVESRTGPAGLRDLDRFLDTAGIELVPVDREQAEIARGAFSRFGEGRHMAGLNFGDCFSYALSKAVGEPLLFKGDDFVHTDVDVVRSEG